MYVVVVRLIQLEWIFLQRITKNMGGAFIGVEDILWEDFFPHLFFGNSKYLTPLIGTLSTIPEKKSGLGLLNPVTSENEKYPSLKYASMELI